MPNRTVVAVAGLLVFALIGWQPFSSGPDSPTSHGVRSPMSEVSLLALERENGCTGESPDPTPAAWPDWGSATIAGGDVQPARVVSDPYPTLHSLVVDPERNRVFMSDPNRHALWSYDRLASSKGREAVEPLTGIRGPATGMMFVAAITVDPKAEEIYTVDNDIGDRMMVSATRQAVTASRSASSTCRTRPGDCRSVPGATSWRFQSKRRARS